MFVRTFPGMFAHRYPLFSPNEGGGEIDLDAEFGADPDPAPADPAPAADPDPAADPAPAGDDPAADPDADPAPAADPDAADPAADPGAEHDPDADPDAEEPPEGRKTDWRDRQLAKRNKQLADAQTALEAAQAESAALRALATPVDGEAPVVVTPEKAREEALAIVRQEQYVTKINEGLKKLDESGGKAFPKSWEARVKQAAEIFGEEMAKKPHFLEALTDLENSAQVYHDLTGDPDRMEALLNMSPVKMGVELAKLSVKLAAKPAVQVSRAPAPIVPLNAPKLVERSLEDLSNDDSPEALDEFDRRMEAEERKRFEAQKGR